MEEQAYKVSFYDEAAGGVLRNFIASSEERRNALLQRLVDIGLSPTYRPLPANMTEQEKMEMHNDILKVCTLSTSVNRMKETVSGKVECVEHVRHPYVFGVEIMLFNEIIINDTKFPATGLLNAKPVYPENVEQIIYDRALQLLDSVGYDFERTEELVKQGKFEIEALLAGEGK